MKHSVVKQNHCSQWQCLCSLLLATESYQYCWPGRGPLWLRDFESRERRRSVSLVSTCLVHQMDALFNLVTCQWLRLAWLHSLIHLAVILYCTGWFEAMFHIWWLDVTPLGYHLPEFHRCRIDFSMCYCFSLLCVPTIVIIGPYTMQIDILLQYQIWVNMYI